MKLQQLKYDILTLNESEQRAVFYEYYEAREKDLAKPPASVRKKAASTKKREKKGPTLKVNPEQLELLRKLKLI
jgi:hypothetical protein